MFNPKEGIKIEGIDKEAYFFAGKGNRPPFIAYIFTNALKKEPEYSLDSEGEFNPTLGTALNIPEFPETVYLNANTTDGRPSFLAQVITDPEKVAELEAVTLEIKETLEALPTRKEQREIEEQRIRALEVKYGAPRSNVDFIEARENDRTRQTYLETPIIEKVPETIRIQRPEKIRSR